MINYFNHEGHKVKTTKRFAFLYGLCEILVFFVVKKSMLFLSPFPFSPFNIAEVTKYFYLASGNGAFHFKNRPLDGLMAPANRLKVVL